MFNTSLVYKIKSLTPYRAYRERKKKVCNKTLAPLSISTPITTTISPSEAFSRVHNSIVGHHGYDRTLAFLKDAKLESALSPPQLRSYLRSCLICQQLRPHSSAAVPLFTTNSIEVFDIFCLDFVGPFPTDNNFKYVLIAVCAFSRFMEPFPSVAANAQAVVSALEQICGRYGMPREVRTDGGAHFCNTLVDSFLQQHGISHHVTTPYRPQANGIVERMNGEFLRHLRALILDERLKSSSSTSSISWASKLSIVQRIINSSPSTATGLPPISLVFGSRVTPFRHELIQLVPDALTPELLRLRSESDRSLIHTAQEQQKRYNNTRSSAHSTDFTPFPNGAYVWVDWPNNQRPYKLATARRGPFLVISSTNGSYTLQSPIDSKTIRIHHSRLSPFIGTADEARAAYPLAHDEFYVDFIVEHRAGASGRAKNPHNWTYRVRWLGYEPDDDTWEPYSNVSSSKALDDYLDRLKGEAVLSVL